MVFTETEADWDTPEADWAPGSDWDESLTQHGCREGNGSSGGDGSASNLDTTSLSAQMATHLHIGPEEHVVENLTTQRAKRQNTVIRDIEYAGAKVSQAGNWMYSFLGSEKNEAKKSKIRTTSETSKSTSPKSVKQNEENRSIAGNVTEKLSRIAPCQEENRFPPLEKEEVLLIHPLPGSAGYCSQDLLKDSSFEQSTVSSMGDTYHEYVKPRLLEDQRIQQKASCAASQPVSRNLSETSKNKAPQPSKPILGSYKSLVPEERHGDAHLTECVGITARCRSLNRYVNKKPIERSKKSADQNKRRRRSRSRSRSLAVPNKRNASRSLEQSHARGRSRSRSRSRARSRSRSRRRSKDRRSQLKKPREGVNLKQNDRPKHAEGCKPTEGAKQQKLRWNHTVAPKKELTDNAMQRTTDQTPFNEEETSLELSKLLLSSDHPTKHTLNHAAHVSKHQKAPPFSIGSVTVIPSPHCTSQRYKDKYKKMVAQQRQKHLLKEECETVVDQGFEMVPFTNEKGADALVCLQAKNCDQSGHTEGKSGHVTVMSVPLPSKKRWRGIWPFKGGGKRRKNEKSRFSPKPPATTKIGQRWGLRGPSKSLPETSGIPSDCMTASNSSLEKSDVTPPRCTRNQSLVALEDEYLTTRIANKNAAVRTGCGPLFVCDDPFPMSRSLLDDSASGPQDSSSFNNTLPFHSQSHLHHEGPTTQAEIVEMVDTITKFKLTAKRLGVPEEELLRAVSFRTMLGDTDSMTRARVLL